GPQGLPGPKGESSTTFESKNINMWQVPLFVKVINALKQFPDIKQLLIKEKVLADDKYELETTLKEFLDNLYKATMGGPNSLKTRIEALEKRNQEEGDLLEKLKIFLRGNRLA
ncbi:hypothetical protein B5M19_03875, partial [Mesomycoplasma hyopneumoniae]|uniref:hypothetical protein n=1 Tax=Mesomycoplasma hyopneumoniae TaxID=2099 RepID=UPI000B6FF1F7